MLKMYEKLMLFPEQSRKEETFNLAMWHMYASMRYSIKASINNKAAYPVEANLQVGDCYLLSSANDFPEWKEYEGWIMVWDGSGWQFSEAQAKQLVYFEDQSAWYYSNTDGGGSWIKL